VWESGSFKCQDSVVEEMSVGLENELRRKWRRLGCEDYVGSLCGVCCGGDECRIRERAAPKMEKALGCEDYVGSLYGVL
jgi:hypothetical protein